MDKGRFLVETHLRSGRPIAELAAAHGVHRSWLYKLLARYRREGEAGLAPRSRRPRSSPTRIADRHEEAIVELRKELSEAGFDAGAATIAYHLARRGGPVPTVSTIWRVLKARGFVVPQPHKRPKSSWDPLRGGAAQCVLAGRRHPRRVGRRELPRGAQHHRRPLPALRGVPGLGDHPLG